MAMKIAKNITIEKDGQKMTFTDEELKVLVRQAFGQELDFGQPPAQVAPQPAPTASEPVIEKAKISAPAKKKGTGKQKPHKQEKSTSEQVHISEEKKKQIMDHVNNRMNEIPQTLSFLLEGISYVPNYLPYIRKMVEAETGVSKVMNGKRVLYFRKRITTAPAAQPAAAPAPSSNEQQPQEQPAATVGETQKVESGNSITSDNNLPQVA
jgi:hypothetical protein